MIAVTLGAYLVVLLGIGLWARGRVANSSDFHLAGRELGPIVAALSASASSSSAWTLLGVSGAAYAWGWPAVWLVPAVLTGFAINWFLVAPRLQQRSRDTGALTLVEFLASDCDPTTGRRIRFLGAGLVLFCFTLYVAAQFQGAGSAIASALPITRAAALVAGAAVVVGYVLLGGFWAASVTDALQGVMMVGVALLLPGAALLATGGVAPVLASLADHGGPSVADPLFWTGIVFVAGLFGIGLGYPGQPHVVNRFMAMRSANDINLARACALLWAAVIYSGMLLLGWCGRVLVPELDDPESLLLTLNVTLLPAMLAGLVGGGVLAAIMSTSDSQLLVAGGAVTHDLGAARASVHLDRWVILLVGVAAVALALGLPASIFSRVLFAWQVLGNAFGPLLLVLLWRGPVPGTWRLAAMICGAGMTMALSLAPDAPGDALERLTPFAAALTLAWYGSRRITSQHPTSRLPGGGGASR